MKYSAEHPPLYCPQTQSRWYRYASRVTPRGVLWHSTGANNPNLRRYVQPSDGAADRQSWLDLLGWNFNGNDWNHRQVQAGVHAFIGKLADGTVSAIQCGPWDLMAWGCGSGTRGSCNNGWIQFEICEDGLEDADYFSAVYREAVELTAYLCALYNLDPQENIRYKSGGDLMVPRVLDHQTSHMLGLGTNHGDVLHWFRRHGKTIQDARNDVYRLLKEENMTGEEINAKLTEYYNTQPTSLYAEAASARNIERGIFLDGNGDGLVDNPKAPMTRQDLSLVIDRLIEKYGLKAKEGAG